MPLNLKATFYPWITQNVDLKIIFSNIDALVQLTAKELQTILGDQVSITLQPALEVPKQIASITSGDSQIAFMNPLGLIFANQINAAVKAVNIVERQIDGQWGTNYFSQVYTSKKTAIRPDNFAKALKGRSIGFGTPISTSNFIIPAYELKLKGIALLSIFNRIEFYGGHELVARAVYDGRVDIGAGHDGAIIDLNNQYGYGNASESLVTLFRSSPIPSDPVGVNIPDTTVFNALQKAFENASKTTEGESAIKTFWGGARHLLPVETSVYDYLLQAVNQLGLTQKDLLGGRE
jgi:ABC-type phosphate/phosphonate transport system substrate-binding protein